MRQSNGCSTPVPRSSKAKQWFEDLPQKKNAILIRVPHPTSNAKFGFYAQHVLRKNEHRGHLAVKTFTSSSRHFKFHVQLSNFHHVWFYSGYVSALMFCALLLRNSQ